MHLQKLRLDVVRCRWVGSPDPATPPRPLVSIFVQCRGLGTGSPPAAYSRGVIAGQADGPELPKPAPLKWVANSATKYLSCIVAAILLARRVRCPCNRGTAPRYTPSPPGEYFRTVPGVRDWLSHGCLLPGGHWRVSWLGQVPGSHPSQGCSIRLAIPRSSILQLLYGILIQIPILALHSLYGATLCHQ